MWITILAPALNLALNLAIGVAIGYLVRYYLELGDDGADADS